MKTFKIISVADLCAWDQIYGFTNMGGTWVLFDSPMTITAVGDTMIFGVRDGQPHNVMAGHTAQVMEVLS